MSQKLCLEFIEHIQPPMVRGLAQKARETILETIPEIREEFKWNLPFYVFKKNLVYLHHFH